MPNNNQKTYDHKITTEDFHCKVTVEFNEEYITEHIAKFAGALVTSGFAPQTVVRGFQEWLDEFSGVFGGDRN